MLQIASNEKDISKIGPSSDKHIARLALHLKHEAIPSGVRLDDETIYAIAHYLVIEKGWFCMS